MGASYDDPHKWSAIDSSLKDAAILQILSTLECVICLEIMHVPFLCSCGHSFCYGCLNSWFKTKLNCPTCRTDLDEPPTLNIQLRDISKAMTDLYIDSLEDGEVRKSLKDLRLEHELEYETAKQTRKMLFGSSFQLVPTIIDTSDGVSRCGNCHWEAHGSFCLNCGERIRHPQEDDYFDSDDGDAYNEDQEEVELYGVENDSYDSADSFLDSRDINEINHDLENDSNLDLDSENESEPQEIPFSRFRDEYEMYRDGDEEDDAVSVSSGSRSISSNGAQSMSSSERRNAELEDTMDRLHERAIESIEIFSDQESDDSGGDIRNSRTRHRYILDDDLSD